ncbi:MAG: DsrE family protein [Alphaproteobacteria bacterium]
MTPDKLSVVVFSGDFTRVHYAFATAAAAAAIDRPVTLFFTMEAIRALVKGGDGEPGWRALEGAAARDAEFGKRGVARFEELVAACGALDVRVLVCEMGLRAVGLTVADLRDDLVYEEGGIVTFLNDAHADGAMLFI